MNILLIHYRYFMQGGPERYLFNVKELLEEKGHTVIPFSVDYSNNERSEYSRYFVKPVIDDFHVSKQKISVVKKAKIAKQFLYHSVAKKNVKRLIKDTKPDVAYVLLYAGKLTYSVLEGCREMDVPVVHRISDFYHYCVRSTFFRDGAVCTECLQDKKACIAYRCVHGSKMQSLLNYYAEEKERKSGIRNYISQIICPSAFTSGIFREHSLFQNAEVSVVPTFFNFAFLQDVSDEQILQRKHTGNICFIGRITHEKGIDCLVTAWKQVEEENIACSLYLTGFFENEYCDQIKKKINLLGLKNVRCFDFLTKEKTFEIINNSFVSVIPSVWFDNMPNSFIESQAHAVPVIASDIGSLTELVGDGKNGFLFPPDDANALFARIKQMFALSDADYLAMAKRSKNFVTDYCSKEKHYEKLMKIMQKAVETKGV